MADWMGRLPDAVKNKPFCSLVIPGSHDSGAHWFNMRLGYAHDQSFLRYIRSLRCGIIKRIVKRWGLTQSLSIEDQLLAGVRFLDLRLEIALDTRYNARRVRCQRRATTEDPKDETSGKSCFVVHGLYSSDWLQLSGQIVKFLEANPEEVIILNASHIYLMGDFDFRRFFLHPLANNAERCGIRICDTHTDLREVTLAQLQERNQRIIIIGPTDQNVDDICFRSTCLQNKWPNLNNTVQLLKYLQAEIHTPVTPGLRVLQSVITPKMSDIFRNLRGSLKTIFSLEMRTILKIWLRRLNEEEIGNMNILISDQVDNEYCRLVYYLNVADCSEHVLDEHFTNPHLEEMPTDTIVDEILWPGKKDLETVELCKTEEMKDEEFKACKEEDKIEEAVNSLPVIKQVEEPDRYNYPPKKPNRTSVMLQQIEMVLVTDTSSEGTSTATRSPIPPPKPKRHTQRIPIVMEVVPIPDVAIPTYYNDMPSVPISRSSDTPVRIALPVTEEELRLAALGEYQPYGSLRSQRLSERRSVQVKEEEEEESADESSPLISHEVESMVEDLIINSTIDVMDNLASKFKEY